MNQPIIFGRAYDYISEQQMLHSFAIFLQSRQKITQWDIYYSPHDSTPIIDYQERKEEKERQLTYNWAYNWAIKSIYCSQN